MEWRECGGFWDAGHVLFLDLSAGTGCVQLA